MSYAAALPPLFALSFVGVTVIGGGRFDLLPQLAPILALPFLGAVALIALARAYGREIAQRRRQAEKAVDR